MSPRTLLRTAAILILIHAILHTVGGMMSEPHRGVAEMAVLAAMKAYQFDVMGSMRSYWDFYFGFGMFATVAMTMEGVLLWQLSSLVSTDPDKARPMLVTLLLAVLAVTYLAWRYFFIAPLVFDIAIVACIGAALLRSRRTPPA